MAHQVVFTDYSFAEDFFANPDIKTAQLSDVSVWFENHGTESEDWHLTFRVQGATGPGRDYVHVSFDTEENPNRPDSVAISHTSSRLIRYSTPEAVEVFRSELRSDVAHPLNVWVFDMIVKEQIPYHDLPTKMLEMEAHHPHSGGYLPNQTFEDRFLSNVHMFGYDISNWFAQV
ncbi:hypothetical protein BJ165DRAFT_1499343 [Panaeolus papilionaceus]|nr:hypothetical protein BJ165DRAFT_1499343 [Panaeolus papilionaceus]